MNKAEGAFLTIGELSQELGVAQHILRYWETRFPQLRPLQRSGNRRYYRPSDVAVARRIHTLLNVQGFTVRGAQRALAERGDALSPEGSDAGIKRPEGPSVPRAPHPAVSGSQSVDLAQIDVDALIERLSALRTTLAEAIERG